MIAHVEGTVSELSVNCVVIDAGGVGFELNVSAQTLASCPRAGEHAKLYTYLAVREDAMELFGFATKEEKRMFLRLIAVSGIGSRSALSILSTLSVHDLSVALVTSDAKALERVPGIGKKTAQRLVLELKDKVDDNELTSGGVTAFTPAAQSCEAEAIEALMALGYPSSEAARAVSAVAGQSNKSNELIFLALKRLGGG